MELSPILYNSFIRPKWFSKLFIQNIMTPHFDFKGRIILDFGSGTGSNSLMFSPQSYLGVDVDCNRVAYAKKHYPGYRFAVLDSHLIPVPANSVDYIVIIAVIHHIPTSDIFPYFREFERILKPSGLILILEPCLRNNTNFNNRFMQFFDNGKFIRHEDEYLEIFHKLSFKTEIKRRFTRLFYNELFFTASPGGNEEISRNPI